MNETVGNMSTSFIYKAGHITKDRFWLESQDGRLFQLDAVSIDVLTRLAKGEPVDAVSRHLEVDEEEISVLLDKLGLEPGTAFGIEYDQTIENVAAPDRDRHIRFINPWIDQPWFQWSVMAALALSVALLGLFLTKVPPLLVSGWRNQWIIAGFLTLAVMIHEAGHLLAMPRHRNIAVTIQWAGPLPMLSILCNEAWKLSKWQRMRINSAGFLADLLVCGVAAAIGLAAEFLSPWVWTFLLIQLIRMVFAIWPLLPGDGYWMLVDGFGQPNLWAHAVRQAKQLNISWLSLYAVARMLFLSCIWLLYAYAVYYWTTLLATRRLQELFFLLLHPAPLLFSLTLIGQLYFLFTGVIKRLRQTIKKPNVL